MEGGILPARRGIAVHPYHVFSILCISILCIAGFVTADQSGSMVQGNKGYFSLHSIPAGADVHFDGIFMGETPVTVPVAATGTRTHTIRITLGGYEPWTTTYEENPRAGQIITLTATLIPAATSADVIVTSSPDGAIATLDGAQPETTPHTFTSVPAGTHQISVYLSGYQTYYGSIDVTGARPAGVFATLSPVIRSGAIAADSVPQGAAVNIDGIYRGVTPTTVGNLVSGQHAITLFKSGYQEWKGEVQVQKGIVTTLSPILVKDPQPVYGTVSIASTPAGAEVYADGLYIGETIAGSPLVFREVKPGTHSLFLTRVGFQDYATTGIVRPGENYDLEITLVQNPQPEHGGIAVTSSPSGAEVFLDNAYRGLSPLSMDALTPGNYHILIRLSGHEDWQSVVNVTPGLQVSLNANLTSVPHKDHRQAGIPPYMIIGSLALALAIYLWKK